MSPTGYVQIPNGCTVKVLSGILTVVKKGDTMNCGRVSLEYIKERLRGSILRVLPRDISVEDQEADVDWVCMIVRELTLDNDRRWEKRLEKTLHELKECEKFIKSMTEALEKHNGSILRHLNS